jgi:hypothetical protein
MRNMSGKTPIGIVPPQILLPARQVDLSKWAVVACDQWTQDRQYWQKAADIAGDSPSTLHLVFPEVYLEDADKDARIAKIHETMRAYLTDGVFAPAETGYIYVERETTGGLRQGLIAAIDLEQYNWKPESKPLIRASEGTIEARLPPRMDIRRAAPLELPHIMLLIDDKKDALFGAIAAGTEPFVYDTSLMQGGGRVRGRFVRDPAGITAVLMALAESSPERYGRPEPFLFAVGDGNHSLAAAKAVWEERRNRDCPAPAGCPASTENMSRNPFRYALAEIVNLYSPALRFEPIHRVLLGPSIDLSALTAPYHIRPAANSAELSSLVRKRGEGTRFGIIQGNRYLLAETASHLLATAILEPRLDQFRAANPAVTLDYIHGEDALFALCERPGTAGFLLPPFEKSGLFETIAQTGPLPRKSFSLGEAPDKRYYLEARRL